MNLKPALLTAFVIAVGAGFGYVFETLSSVQNLYSALFLPVACVFLLMAWLFLKVLTGPQSDQPLVFVTMFSGLAIMCTTASMAAILRSDQARTIVIGIFVVDVLSLMVSIPMFFRSFGHPTIETPLKRPF